MLVGITGHAGAGKDTVGDWFAKEHGFIKESFADPIKAMVNTLLRAHSSQWDDRKWKETPILCGKSPRFLAQTLGTEWGREIVGHDIWINACLEGIDLEMNTVITDVRFDNEAQAIKERGGIIFEIGRPSYWDTLHKGHSSEGGVSMHLIDWVISNDKGVNELHRKLEIITQFIGLRKTA